MPAFAWPLSICGAIVVLGLTLIVRHHEAIDRLIDRTRHIGKTGVTTGDPTTAVTAQAEAKIDTAKPSATDELMNFDNQLLIEQEKTISDFMNDKGVIDVKDRNRVLTRYLASSYIVGRFEKIYMWIYGSQLQALHMLNQAEPNGMPMSAMEAWYSIGIAGYPSMYGEKGERYPFGQWLGFMYRWILITTAETNVHITVNGREFLKYIVDAAYSQDRIG